MLEHWKGLPMHRQVKLRQDVLNHEVAAVFRLVRICEFDAIFVAGLRYEC